MRPKARRKVTEACPIGDVLPDISVVIPAYNEEASIKQCIFETAGVLSTLQRLFEIVVVDDGSRDATFQVLRDIRRELPQLRAVRFRQNRGQTAAMEAGFRAARGKIVVTVDADLQNDPADIPKLLDAMGEWDAVCGVRVKRQDSFVRLISSRIANWVRNTLSGESIRDTGCTLKAYRRDALMQLKLFEGMHRFLPTLLKLAGYRVTEMAVGHRPRLYGETKYNVGNRVFKSFRDLLAVRWMKRRWIHYDVEEEI